MRMAWWIRRVQELQRGSFHDYRRSRDIPGQYVNSVSQNSLRWYYVQIMLILLFSSRQPQRTRCLSSYDWGVSSFTDFNGRGIGGFFRVTFILDNTDFFPSPVLLSTLLHWVIMSVLCRLATLSRISSLGFSYWIWRMTFCVRGVMGLNTVCVTLRFPKWAKIETDYSVFAYRWRKSRTSCTTCPWETWSQRVLQGLIDETGACSGILNSRFGHLKDIATWIMDHTGEEHRERKARKIKKKT